MNDRNPSPRRKRSAPNQTPQTVWKTYKLYIGGQFPRTESQQYYQVGSSDRDRPAANVCRASRKDIRNAVVAARQAQAAWAARSAFNRSQILYRIAEMLSDRSQQFQAELQQQGVKTRAAEIEVQQAIDRVVHFCGWCDKFQQICSTVNPVASSHFSFSVLEPLGVVGLIADEQRPLLGLISLLMPIVAGGNTCVVLASESRPLSAVTFGEVLQTADVPPGVVNILTGRRHELIKPLAAHHDVDGIAADCDEDSLIAVIRSAAADSVTRVRQYELDWTSDESMSPYLIFDFCETKTIWHPVERITATGSGY